MERIFNTIGLIGRQRSPESIASLEILCDFLVAQNYTIRIEADTASFLTAQKHPIYDKEGFAEACDLVIVVGGDGSLLNAAHLVVSHDIPVLGINRGRLGFLTDIHPKDLTTEVNKVLQGEFVKEKRFLLNAQIRHEGKVAHEDMALNDVVLMPGKYAHMLEFEIYINQQFVCSQRADGQIIATPTGSTAYALSGGGPILHPNLNAIVLVPMFPHTLSSRPIVVDSDAEIDIVIIPRFETSPRISCDGQALLPIALGDTLHVTKKPKYLTLLHPKSYNYYETLRKKLLWETRSS